MDDVKVIQMSSSIEGGEQTTELKKIDTNELKQLQNLQLTLGQVNFHSSSHGRFLIVKKGASNFLLPELPVRSSRDCQGSSKFTVMNKDDPGVAVEKKER